MQGSLGVLAMPHAPRTQCALPMPSHEFPRAMPAPWCITGWVCPHPQEQAVVATQGIQLPSALCISVSQINRNYLGSEPRASASQVSCGKLKHQHGRKEEPAECREEGVMLPSCQEGHCSQSCQSCCDIYNQGTLKSHQPPAPIYENLQATGMTKAVRVLHHVTRNLEF
jgi:hypothetical protein